MTYRLTPFGKHSPAVTTIIVEAARCWREACDSRKSTQPRLFATLSRRDCGMLAPVFDSLMALYEAALGRRLSVGRAALLSEDEMLLLGLLNGSKRTRACLNCGESAATAFNCALCSTRIMMGLAIGPATASRG